MATQTENPQICRGGQTEDFLILARLLCLVLKLRVNDEYL